MKPFDIHANAGLRGGRIESLSSCDYLATAEDHSQAARECTTFLDRCAAEAAAERWFRTMTLRSTVRDRITDALRKYRQLTVPDLVPLLGNQRNIIEKNLRIMLAEGEVAVVGTLPTMGRPRVYALRETQP